jgi:dihydropteroate synthase
LLIDKKAPQRDFGTAATMAVAIQGGVDIVRVHNVAMAVDVVKVSDAIARTKVGGCLSDTAKIDQRSL